MKTLARPALRSAATSISTMAGVRIRALTERHPIKPTSPRCHSAWQLNLGRHSTYRRGKSVQTTGTTSLIHYFLRFKLIESMPTFATGLFGWLIGYRLLIWWRKTRNELPTWVLLALSVIIGTLTFIAEAIALGIEANVSPLRVLQSAFEFDFDMIRPGWLVLCAGLIVAALDFVCARFAKAHGAARWVEPPLT